MAAVVVLLRRPSRVFFARTLRRPSNSSAAPSSPSPTAPNRGSRGRISASAVARSWAPLPLLPRRREAAGSEEQRRGLLLGGAQRLGRPSVQRRREQGRARARRGARGEEQDDAGGGGRRRWSRGGGAGRRRWRWAAAAAEPRRGRRRWSRGAGGGGAEAEEQDDAGPTAARAEVVPSSAAARFLVIANGMAACYSLLQGARCMVSILTGGVLISRPMAWAIFSCDQVMAYFTISAVAVAMEAAMIGKYGNTQFQWMKTCHLYKRFCAQAGGAVACAVAVSLNMVGISFVSAFNLFRLYGSGKGRK